MDRGDLYIHGIEDKIMLENNVIITKAIFVNKQNISWNEVEQYLKRYIGKEYIVKEYHDTIIVASDFPNEYAESKYTKRLRGALAKVKANAAQVVDLMIMNAINRRWIENKDNKHKIDASEGWYRYDTYFGMQVKGSEDILDRINYYKATLVVRKTNKGLYLYDIINIKKEASMPLESK